MKRKILFLIIIAILTASFCLSGCQSEPEISIVYLGDSIAEGIAGMAPLSERAYYSYYSVLGIRNEYEFKCRAVSGHRTIDMISVIEQEDLDARMTRTVLKNADIIHISILGNDLLLNDLGKLIVDVAKDDYAFLDNLIADSTINFARIVEILRGYNPTAYIFFQKVYNPVDENSLLIKPAVRTELDGMGIQPSQYREYAGIILDKLNGIIDKYLEDHPNAFHIIDAYAEFDRIYQENNEIGMELIAGDCIHPSIHGHAVLADLNQRVFEEMGLAESKTALKNYKALRKEQLKRLYKDSVEVSKINRHINKAKTCAEVTEIYFDAIRDKTPIYY